MRRREWMMSLMACKASNAGGVRLVVLLLLVAVVVLEDSD